MTRGNGNTHRMSSGLKLAYAGCLAALLALSMLLNSSPAFAENRYVEYECRAGGLSEKVVLTPVEEGIEIDITGCMCGKDAASLKIELAERVIYGHIPGAPFSGTSDGDAIATGEKRDFIFYCYTPEQFHDYIAQAEQAAAGD